jgi:DNA-binding transcriptional LysR family regulator
MQTCGEMSVFVRVVDAGGFSAAARNLNLTPSAVSKLITRLEDRLDVRLLNRTTRHLSMTEEGEAFYHRATAILHDIEEAENEVTRSRAVPHGLLRITCATGFGNYQVVRVLPEFMERYPAVRLDFRLSDSMVDLIEEGMDVGIRHGRIPTSSLIVRQLVIDQRRIVASPSYLARHGIPRTPEDLLDHNCLNWGHSQRHLNRWPFDGGKAIHVRGNTEINNGETLYRLAIEGMGLVRMAAFVAGAATKQGRLTAVLEDYTRMDSLPIYAVYPHRRHLSSRVRAFVDFLVEKFSPVPPWLA